MSASLRETIQALATTFAAGVLEAIRGSSLEDILVETSGGPRRGRGRPGAARAGAATEAGVRGRRLGRRSPGALEGVVERIVDLLSKHPDGLRAEQIRAELDLSARELPRPIAMAIGAKRIRKEGRKRATTYFLAGRGSGAGGRKRGQRDEARNTRPTNARRANPRAEGADKLRVPGTKPTPSTEQAAAPTAP
jgi:hypothetical protein